MNRHWILAFFIFFFQSDSFGQFPDSLTVASAESVPTADMLIDSIKTAQSLQWATRVPFYVCDTTADVKYDVQQMNPKKNNTAVILILFLLLALVTYVKTAFGNDLEELLQSFINRNIAMQIFRTRTEEITFSSFLLHVNFIVVFSLFVRFFLVHYYHTTTLDSFSSILFLIILFTFFYLAKILVVRLLGYVFEVRDISDEYIFNLSLSFKTLGMALIPALFVFYVAPEKFFDFIFSISLLLILAFIVLFILRGLSTGYKLMYKSVYHFFLYVCVVEISPIFLLFKLLTKTVV